MHRLKTLAAMALAATTFSAFGQTSYWVMKPIPSSRGATVTPPLPAEIKLTTGILPEAKRGRFYAFDFKALTSIEGAGKDWSSVVWSLGEGTLPTGMNLTSEGKLTGVPSAKTDPIGLDFAVVGSYKTASGQQAYTIKVGEALLQITQIAVGSTHVCGVTTSGGAKCWGSNASGQLGNNGTTRSPIPVDVVGLTSGVSQISAGATHTCAVTTTGGAKCWGYNGSGRLGNNSTTQTPVPVDVFGLTSGVASISAGGAHTCAVTASGGAKCWGENYYGRLGNASATDSSIPVDVVGLTSGVATVSTSDSHTCALTTTGGAKCWGPNFEGQLGNGSWTSSQVPVDVVGLTSGVASLTVGSSYSCARTAAGAAKCWGFNGNGRLGNNSTTSTEVPGDVVGLSAGVASIQAGFASTCAVMSTGSAKCWGSNTFGQLGNNSNTSSMAPVDVLGLTLGVTTISAGTNHACALTIGGGAKCWGLNSSGQLGNNSTVQSFVPVEVVD